MNTAVGGERRFMSTSNDSSNGHGLLPLYYELLTREPFGSSFLLRLMNGSDGTVAKLEIAARYARILWVLDDAANEESAVEEWCGYISAEEIGERYGRLPGSEHAINVMGVRALVYELRTLIKNAFAGAAVRAGERGAPPLVETKRLLGYRIAPGRLAKLSGTAARSHSEPH